MKEIKTKHREKKNAPESFQEKKDRGLFNDIAEKYCRKDISVSSRIPRKYRLLRTLSVLPQMSGVKILEVGCGCGYAADYLAGLYGKYIGVDYAERLIEYAQKYNGKSNASFVVANINDYHPDEKVDVVIMVGVLHHFEDYNRTFRHILDLLKTGGWLVINEPQSGNFFVQIARKARAVLDKGYSAEQGTFSYKRLRKLYEENDLGRIKIIPQGVWSTPFAEVTLKPDFIFGAVARMAVLADTLVESVFGMLLKYISWNLIAAGQKK